ncbi:MAG: GDYXXLXY domain-containing protein, partial [Pseudomonadota bacterium]|nr:GDYXXLXY domain-containing protein [Pseudomonadota bacterium]
MSSATHRPMDERQKDVRQNDEHQRDERALIEHAQAQGLLPPEARSAWQQAAGPSWVITALSFVGAQLVTLPFLALLGVMAGAFFFELPGSFIAAAALVGGAVAVLRGRPGMFLSQMAFSALLAGLVLGWAGFGRVDWFNTGWLALAAAAVGVALAIPVRWVQRVLGVVAAVALMCLALPRFGVPLTDLIWTEGFFPQWPNTELLALVWALWVAREPRWAGWLNTLHWAPARAWAPALHALADGLGAALLLAVAYGSTRYFWVMAMFSAGPAGSADVLNAGEGLILQPGWPALLQAALVLGAAGWLARHWRLRHSPRRDQALLAVAYAVLLAACLVLPQVGVVALLGTLALGSGRRLMLALALAVLLAQLSGFYYALHWPLAHKAALLAALGGALSVALWAIGTGRPAQAAPLAAGGQAAAPARGGWLAGALIALGALLSVALVQWDVAGKERVMAQGQKIYVPLAPRDPRSLMQGDYMALNFDLPQAVLDALDKAPPLSHQVHVAATLNARGVATVQRLLAPGEPLAPGQVRLPLKRLKGQWTLVTDAFFFPEGQGRPFAQARFGEFRALPDGRALLVGLVDEQLNPIAPAPSAAWDDLPQSNDPADSAD